MKKAIVVLLSLLLASCEGGALPSSSSSLLQESSSESTSVPEENDSSVTSSSIDEGPNWSPEQQEVIASVLGADTLPYFDLPLTYEVRAIDGALSIVSYETMLMSEMTTVAGDTLVSDGYEYITSWYPNTPYGMRILQKKTDTHRLEVRIFTAEDRPAEGEVDPTAFTRGEGYFWLYLTVEERSSVYPTQEIANEVLEYTKVLAYYPPEPVAPEGIHIYDYRLAPSSSSLFQNASSVYLMVETDDIRGLGVAYGEQLVEAGYHLITAFGGAYLSPDGRAFLTLHDFEGAYLAIVIDGANGYSPSFPSQDDIDTAYRTLFGVALGVEIPTMPDDVEVGCYAPLSYLSDGTSITGLSIYCFVEDGDPVASYGAALLAAGWSLEVEDTYLSPDGTVEASLLLNNYFAIILAPKA